MYKGKKIGVVTAAYNEEQFIEEVITTMPSFVDRIYVTNDGSDDITTIILAQTEDNRLVVTHHQHRMGAGAATITGYKKALEENMDIIAVMAGDGQMDPLILDKILDPVVEDRADYSKGDRLSNPIHITTMPKWRAFGNNLLTWLNKMASGYWDISDPQNGYTAISRKYLEKIDLDSVEKGFAFENHLMVLLNVCNARVANVPIQSRYRGERSKIRYLHFIPNTSWLLLKYFFYRIWKKYLVCNS